MRQPIRLTQGQVQVQTPLIVPGRWGPDITLRALLKSLESCHRSLGPGR